MDEAEAAALLEDKLREYRARPYAELEALIGTVETGELTGPTGVSYQFEIEAVWDALADGNIRVIGAIDDGGMRAFKPLGSDFIVAPDGSFVGEP
jgi:hypothetical protein